MAPFFQVSGFSIPSVDQHKDVRGLYQFLGPENHADISFLALVEIVAYNLGLVAQRDGRKEAVVNWPLSSSIYSRVKATSTFNYQTHTSTVLHQYK